MAMGRRNIITFHKDMQEQQANPQNNKKEDTTITKHIN
jgi:hypothetical protein